MKPEKTDHPILFSAPMVRAILAGTKTQTRRVVKPKMHGRVLSYLPECEFYEGTSIAERTDRTSKENWGWENIIEGDPCTLAEMEGWQLSPYGKVGHTMWVRETFGYVSPDEQRRPHSECNIEYRADLAPGCTDRPGQWPLDEAKGNPDAPKWRPAIHMPRTAARINLNITGIRIERLQAITGADAVAEGIERTGAHSFRSYTSGGEITAPTQDGAAIGSYASLWCAINGPEAWAANPWVWVVEFKPAV